jgi:hypothetical protein
MKGEECVLECPKDGVLKSAFKSCGMCQNLIQFKMFGDRMTIECYNEKDPHHSRILEAKPVGEIKQ